MDAFDALLMAAIGKPTKTVELTKTAESTMTSTTSTATSTSAESTTRVIQTVSSQPQFQNVQNKLPKQKLVPFLPGMQQKSLQQMFFESPHFQQPTIQSILQPHSHIAQTQPQVQTPVHSQKHPHTQAPRVQVHMKQKKPLLKKTLMKNSSLSKASSTLSNTSSPLKVSEPTKRTSSEASETYKESKTNQGGEKVKMLCGEQLGEKVEYTEFGNDTSYVTNKYKNSTSIMLMTMRYDRCMFYRYKDPKRRSYEPDVNVPLKLHVENVMARFSWTITKYHPCLKDVCDQVAQNFNFNTQIGYEIAITHKESDKVVFEKIYNDTCGIGEFAALVTRKKKDGSVIELIVGYEGGYITTYLFYQYEFQHIENAIGYGILFADGVLVHCIGPHVQ